ncbi:MAG TPA: PucR family transcriptional regulator [Micromonosporaceae bacterium]|nr:PucR family transcriptional regulator [Micromonosporaceae bacterium]
MADVYPSVREVLALDSMRYGNPRVVAGADALDRPVRWVHAAEVPDIATLLRGGELVLMTGIGLPGDDDGIRSFIAGLADIGAAGLVVELGRRYPESVPKVMVAAANKRNLPLVELRKATPFVRITEAVHALIVDAQVAELRATEEIHQRFTELSVEGGDAAEVVAQAGALAGAPVVFENLSRQVLAYDAAGDRPELLLDGWESHSRRIRVDGRTGYDADAGWLVTMVGARGQDWGRLLLRYPPAGTDATTEPPPTRLVILLERAASTLALGRLIRRDAEGLERQIHRTLLTALLDHTRPVDEVALRAKALGVPLERRRLVGVVIRQRQDDAEPSESPPSTGVKVGPVGSVGPVGPVGSVGRVGSVGSVGRVGSVGPVAGAAAERTQERLRDIAESVSAALRSAGLDGLTSPLDDLTVGVLIALRRGDDDETALAAFAAALRRPHGGSDLTGRDDNADERPAARGLIVAAGSVVDTLREARRSLMEARQIGYAARHDRRDVAVFRLPHVGLAGLLHLLRDEPRLQTFVERELGPLLAYDAKHPSDQLLQTLRVYLESGRNKSAAAAAAHLSRPAFYERLARIGRILGVDLDAVEPCLSLHVALLALDAIRDA